MSKKEIKKEIKKERVNEIVHLNSLAQVIDAVVGKVWGEHESGIGTGGEDGCECGDRFIACGDDLSNEINKVIRSYPNLKGYIQEQIDKYNGKFEKAYWENILKNLEDK